MSAGTRVGKLGLEGIMSRSLSLQVHPEGALTQQPIPSPVATDTGPALAVFNNRLYAAWKGSDGDERIWWSSFDGTSWAPQQAMPDPIRTSTRVWLTAFNAEGVFSSPLLLYAAWKGGDGDERIWWSTFDGTSWAPQQAMPDPIRTTNWPSMMEYFPPDTEAARLYAAWKGGDGDERIWWSSLNGTVWIAPFSGQAPTQAALPSPIASNVGPSLAYFNSDPNALLGLLYAAWKGAGSDERIWYSSFDGTSWAPQAALPSPIFTSMGPSLAAFGNNLLWAAWKGGDGDERIWYSSFDGTSWAPQQVLPSPLASSVGPSIAVFNNLLYLAWKGGGSDTRIWWTSATVISD
jgi:hypothetical protein